MRGSFTIPYFFIYLGKQTLCKMRKKISDNIHIEGGNIHNLEQTMTLYVRKGTEVTQKKFSQEFLEDIGFLNFDAIKKFLK